MCVPESPIDVQALGRIHHTLPCGYVFIKQSDSPCNLSSSTLEPMILPKLLIYFADFPYKHSSLVSG